jgi:hypothetical protein
VEHYKLRELSIVEKEHTESHPVPNLGQCSVKHSSRLKFTHRILTDAIADNQLRIYLYSARSYGLTSCDWQSPNYEPRHVRIDVEYKSTSAYRFVDEPSHLFEDDCGS